MSWYMVLWSDGLAGSWTRPAPQQSTAPERKVIRMDFWCAMPCRVRIRYVRSRSWRRVVSHWVGFDSLFVLILFLGRWGLGLRALV